MRTLSNFETTLVAGGDPTIGQIGSALGAGNFDFVREFNRMYWSNPGMSRGAIIRSLAGRAAGPVGAAGSIGFWIGDQVSGTFYEPRAAEILNGIEWLIETTSGFFACGQ